MKKHIIHLSLIVLSAVFISFGIFSKIKNNKNDAEKQG